MNGLVWYSFSHFLSVCLKRNGNSFSFEALTSGACTTLWGAPATACAGIIVGVVTKTSL